MASAAAEGAAAGPPGRGRRRGRRRSFCGGRAALALAALAASSAGWPLAAAAAPLPSRAGRPHVRWAQTNSTIFITVEPPKGPKLLDCESGAALILQASVTGPDRIGVEAGCGDGEAQPGGLDGLRWELELREDIIQEKSRAERLSSGGGAFLSLRKLAEHRWDRLLQDEAQAQVSKDWKREDRNMPEEEELELPRALNIRRLSFESLRAAAAEKVVVAAMRYPWCTSCEEKDKAFVKITKVVGGKERFSEVVFGALDLREEKRVARELATGEELHTCKKKCHVHVFKPDEPLDEPYTIDIQLLYEMDEYSMMNDPMAGAPGHTPKGQAPKPNFERFEAELARLLPPALPQLQSAEELEDFRGQWGNAVLGAGVNATAFRHVARRLRGTASFALLADGLLPAAGGLSAAAEQGQGGGGGAAVELRASAATPARARLRFEGPLEPLDAGGLERFVRAQSQPLLQNYSWDLKDRLEAIGLPVAVLWVNRSDANATNTTLRALQAFELLCDRRRGTDEKRHVLCCVQDETYSYYQREYGSHEPYPFPFFGVTLKLGFGEGMRWGYPFKEPVNKTVHGFFKRPKHAANQMSSWLGRVLAGRVPPSHESGLVPERPRWVRGEVQEVVWKTFQKEVNGTTADTLLELYDNQRKQAHIADATMRIVAATLKDYANLKVARMESGANYVPPVFGRQQYAKETEYYWVPPSIAAGELTPEPPIRYTGTQPVTAEKLLRFLKKHSLSHWSLKEALEVASDFSAEIMGQAKVEQREDDRAEKDKQEMIQKMMTTLKKEKGLVDVGEMMGLKKAADAMNADKADAAEDKKPKPPSKPAAAPGMKDPPPKASSKARSPSKSPPSPTTSAAEEEKARKERKLKLQRDEERLREIDLKEKERRKKRKEADKKRKELKKAQEAAAKAREAKEAEKRRKKREEERALAPATALFSWAQSNRQLRVSVSVPGLNAETLNVTIRDDALEVRGRDGRNRSYSLGFELREFVVPENSSWAVRLSEESSPRPDGVTLTLQKAISHRWDRIAQNHTAIKYFMRKDWVQDDGELEEEAEDVELPSGPNLRKATAATLAKLTASNPMVVAALRFPWCDKCKEKDRHFAKAAKESRDKDHLGSISFVSLDAREEKYLARLHNISCSDACPLLIFKQDEPGEPYTVPGRRYHEEIHIDCYKHLLPVVSVVEDKDTFGRVTSAFDTAIVGFFQGKRGEDAWYPRFRAVARQLRGHALFGAIFEGRAPRDFGIEHDAAPSRDRGEEEGEWGAEAERPLVLLFKPKENRHVEFTGDLTLEKLTHFSRVLSLPLISTYEFESRQKYQELKVPLGMMWLDGEDAERKENAYAKEIVRRLALRFSGHLVFVLLNGTRDGLLMRPMALDPRRVPTFGIASTDELESSKFGFDMQLTNPSERNAFWADTDRAYSRLEAFCASFLDGTLEASHESAELPPTYRWPGPGAVHEVVWKTFRESVYRTEHDVLLELYSPFRPQHRTYLTVLDLVAEALSELKGLKVVRMDTANNYVLPEFGLKDKEKASSLFFLRAAPELERRPRRFGGRGGRAEALPEKLLRFVHRETRGHMDWDVAERVAWVNKEAMKRIKRLRAIEKDYEKKMQDEWMQKEMEEFERYKRLGKFDNMNLS